MADLLTTLAVQKGEAEALKKAKTEVDACAAKLANLQSQKAADIAATVEALGGLDTVGYYSSVDLLLRTERFAGKEASVLYIKANPECLEAAAIAAWDAAATAATGLPFLLQNTANMAVAYRTNLVAGGYIAEPTWEAQRAWIVATPIETIMGA